MWVVKHRPCVHPRRLISYVPIFFTLYHRPQAGFGSFSHGQGFRLFWKWRGSLMMNPRKNGAQLWKTLHQLWCLTLSCCICQFAMMMELSLVNVRSLLLCGLHYFLWSTTDPCSYALLAVSSDPWPLIGRNPFGTSSTRSFIPIRPVVQLCSTIHQKFPHSKSDSQMCPPRIQLRMTNCLLEQSSVSFKEHRFSTSEEVDQSIIFSLMSTYSFNVVKSVKGRIGEPK